jgi:methylmalonyl-CoA mutase
VRFVTAASLFDGHDAAINIMRRILQGMGAEVIHLGHNRSVDEVVTAAAGRRAGHCHQLLPGRACRVLQVHGGPARERGGAHIQVFGGGGGVIVPAEIRELQAYGVSASTAPKTASAWAWPA